MKTRFYILLVLFSVAPLLAQENPRPRSQPARPTRPGPLLAGNRSGTNAPGDYRSDIAVIHDAQAQALEQAKEMLAEMENERDRAALETAMKQMELAQAALNDAKSAPDKLPAAVAAEQAAYQALLKVMPREYRMTRSQGGGQGEANQPNREQLNQLDMPREENRYETERQAESPQNGQQREQSQTAARLKELAQRQQDVNERLRELQTALQAARTEAEREDIQRQLKRLREEQRQMLANLDELRQQVDRSQNAESRADTQQQLDQARSDMQRAVEEMDKDSASQALAAGTRAQQAMQNLRDDLRRQSTSQFAEQMRQLRNQARELERKQAEIARELDSLSNGKQQSLDNSAQREQLTQKMDDQQGAFTNLLAGMRDVTEQAEVTEPLLAKQLYDTMRRAAPTEGLLEMESQLAQRGFLPQAGEAERVARTNITSLVQSVERAAESVLGSEVEALRYAQKELDDLARQMEREIAGNTNSAAGSRGQSTSGQSRSNFLAGAQSPATNAERVDAIERYLQSNGRQENGQGNQGNPGNGNQSGDSQAGQNPGEGQQQAGGNSPGELASSQPGEQGQAGSQPGEQPGSQAGGQAQGGSQPGGQGQAGSQASSQAGGPTRAGARNSGSANVDGGNEAGGGGGDGLRQFVDRLNRTDRTDRTADRNNGPITGSGYVNWADRLRDVQEVLDPADLRNQLATIRERAAVLRGEYRDRKRVPDGEVVREQILAPLSQVRVWLQEELTRRENANSLVPLDRDPVPEKYSELVRQYYEKLGSAR